MAKHRWIQNAPMRCVYPRPAMLQSAAAEFPIQLESLVIEIESGVRVFERRQLVELLRGLRV